MPKNMKPQRALFVKEYLKDFNATHAAIRAGYTPKAANQTGYQIMQDPKVVKIIEKEIAERSVRTGVTPERVLIELARIAYANLQDIEGKEMSELSREDAAAVYRVTKRVNVQSGEIIYRYSLIDKTKAIELLMKHLGMININIRGKVEHRHDMVERSDEELIKDLETYLKGVEDGSNKERSRKNTKGVKKATGS